MNNNNAWGQPDQPSTDPSTQRKRPLPREEQAWDTPSPNSPTTSTTAASPTGEGFDASKSSGKGKRIVFLVIAVLAVFALVGGLTWALVNRNDSSDADDPNEPALAASSEAKDSSHPEKGSESDKDEDNSKKDGEKDSPERKNNAKSQELTKYEKCNEYADDKLSDLRAPIKMYCDDSWLFAGEDGTSSQALFYWTDNAWHRYETDGTSRPSHMGCYNRSKLEDAGAPLPLLDKVLLCDANDKPSAESAAKDEAGASAKSIDEMPDDSAGPRCDGRYILIAESVMVPLGSDPHPELSRVQGNYPGSHTMSGKACSSLRGQVDGNDVYAVYFDAGHSVEKVCELKAQYGGNARSLNNDADFSDPC